jgi:hypothetical protein
LVAEDDDLALAEAEQELPPDVEEKKRRGALRTGYTTGTVCRHQGRALRTCHGQSCSGSHGFASKEQDCRAQDQVDQD